MNALWRSCPVRLLMGTVLLAGVSVAWAHFQFGSVPIALAYLKGERLIIHPAVFKVVEEDSEEDRELRFTIANRTGGNVKFIGVSAGCGCRTNEEFPFDLPSGERRELTFIARARTTCTGSRLLATVYSDCAEKPMIPVLLLADESGIQACPVK